jgi:hypothetical protein
VPLRISFGPAPDDLDADSRPYKDPFHRSLKSGTLPVLSFGLDLLLPTYCLIVGVTVLNGITSLTPLLFFHAT